MSSAKLDGLVGEMSWPCLRSRNMSIRHDGLGVAAMVGLQFGASSVMGGTGLSDAVIAGIRRARGAIL